MNGKIHFNVTCDADVNVRIQDEARARTLGMQSGCEDVLRRSYTRAASLTLRRSCVRFHRKMRHRKIQPTVVTRAAMGLYNSSLSGSCQPIIDQKTWRLGLWLVWCRMTKSRLRACSFPLAEDDLIADWPAAPHQPISKRERRCSPLQRHNER